MYGPIVTVAMVSSTARLLGHRLAKWVLPTATSSRPYPHQYGRTYLLISPPLDGDTQMSVEYQAAYQINENHAQLSQGY